MKIGDLFFSLGFDVKADNLKTFQKGLDDTIYSLGVFADVKAAAALYAIDKLVRGATAGASALHNFTEQTGLSNEELQKWQAAATLSNTSLSVDEVTQSVVALNTQLTQIKAGTGGNSNAFLNLRLNAFELKDAFAALEALRGAAKRTDKGYFATILDQLGVSRGMINVLNLSDEAFRKFSRGIGVGAGDIEELQRAGGIIRDFELRLDNFVTKIVAKYVPQIDELAHHLKDIGADMVYLAETFPTASKAVASGLAAILVFASPLARLTTAIGVIVEGLKQFSDYEQGKPNLIGEKKLGFFSDLKNKVGENMAGYFPGFSKQALAGITNIDNNFTIHTVPDNLVDDIMRQQLNMQHKYKQSNSQSLDDVNNGNVR